MESGLNRKFNRRLRNRNRRDESIFRKECIEKGISMKEAMIKRFKKLSNIK